MLQIDENHRRQMLALAQREYPLEACGLLFGAAGSDRVDRFVPIDNEAASSRIFRLDGAQYARAALEADNDGLDIVGVMHSHTRTEAYPSPTDLTAATNTLVPASWHWVIVGLASEPVELRSFQMSTKGGIVEEAIEIRRHPDGPHFPTGCDFAEGDGGPPSQGLNRA